MPTAWPAGSGGDAAAWRDGNFADWLPQGRYRNKWYQAGTADGAFFALGIHGQWLYVNPAAETEIAKFSSQPVPVDDAFKHLNLALFAALPAMVWRRDGARGQPVPHTEASGDRRPAASELQTVSQAGRRLRASNAHLAACVSGISTTLWATSATATDTAKATGMNTAGSTGPRCCQATNTAVATKVWLR